MKILVIDTDNERIQRLQSLEREGHLVQSLASWDEAVSLLDQAVVQMLVLGSQVDEDVSAWRRSTGDGPAPTVVGMNSGVNGVDHVLSLPLEADAAASLPALPGIPAEPEPTDYSKALDICDNDEELFREVAEIFLGEGPKRLKRMEQALADRNWKAVAEAAHLMKGSSLNLAAEPLRRATRYLEKAGDAGEPALVRFWSGQTLYEYQRLDRYLRGLIDGLADSG